jgi:hypothetical protein
MPADRSESLVLLAEIVRGEREWEAVREVGVKLEFPATGCQAKIPAGTPEFDPSAQDVARGYLVAARRGDLQRWAQILQCGPFGFDEFNDTPDGERLKDILWNTSFGTPLGDEDHAFVKRLAEAAD